MADGIVLSEETFNYLMAAANKVHNLRGDGIVNTPTGLTINTKQAAVSGTGARLQTRWVKITGNTLLTTNRYSYSGVEVVAAVGTLGSLTWTTKAGGITYISNLFNSLEGLNDGSGVEGNNIDVSSGTFLPVQNNTVVEVIVIYDSSGNAKNVFTFANSVDCG